MREAERGKEGSYNEGKKHVNLTAMDGSIKSG